MICPECLSLLQTTNRLGIEIDHCFNCGGIWLNRGELEKIIQKSSEQKNKNRSDAPSDNGFLGNLLHFTK